MPRQQRRVVHDGLVLGPRDHLHRDELAAEGHHVQLGAHGLVRLQDLGQGHALQAPAGELEDTGAGLGRRRRCV